MVPSVIYHLNDLHREAIPASKLIISRGIDRLGSTAVSEIIEKVRSFEDFNDDNDPYGERDYGSFEYNGEKLYWKIDYYNKEYDGGSEDPSDPEKTSRILTIAKLSEY